MKAADMASLSSEVSAATRERPSRWATHASLACAAVAAGVAILLQAGAWIELVRVWRSSTFAHCFLILPISAFLIWQQRKALAALAPQPFWPATAVVALLGVTAWLARSAGLQIVEHAAVVASVPAAIWAICGTAFVRRIAFPLAFLVFAVPFGEMVVPALMEWTATFVVAALRILGIPVYRDGLFFSLPGGDFLVEKACSGIRYLIAMLAVGSLYSYLAFHTTSRRLLFILLSALVPLAANGLRALGIVLLAHFSDMRIAVGVDHLIYGWIFFGVVLLLMFWLGSFLREREAPSPEVAEAHSSAGAAIINPRLLLGATALFAALAAGPAVGWFNSARPAADVPDFEPSLPAQLGDWQGVAASVPDWNARFPGAKRELLKSYAHRGRLLSVYAAYYATQSQGAEATNSGNRLLGTDWRLLAQHRREIELADGTRWPLVSRQYRKATRQRDTWHWYLVGDRFVGSDLHATVLSASQRFRGDVQGVAYVAVVVEAPLVASPPEQPNVEGFLAQHGVALVRCLTPAAARRWSCQSTGGMPDQENRRP